MDDAVQGGAVHDEVAQYREAGGAPGLDRDGGAILEGGVFRQVAHVQLAGGGADRPVGLPVDDHTALPADALTAVGVEGHRLLALGEELLVEQVEDLEETHVLLDPAHGVLLEVTLRVLVLLAPDLELDVHL